VVVSSVAVVGAISGAVSILTFVEAAPSDVRIFLLLGGVVGVLIGAAGPFVTWLLYALAFQLLTYFFGGEGEFRDTFALTGWGFLPRAFGAVLSLVVTVYLAQTMTPPADVAGIQAYTAQLQNQPVYRAVSVAGILFTLWSAYIWVAAVQRARDVTRGQAIVAVAIPVLLGILVTVASLLLSTLAQGPV
jgi:hypothetical protein